MFWQPLNETAWRISILLLGRVLDLLPVIDGFAMNLNGVGRSLPYMSGKAQPFLTRIK